MSSPPPSNSRVDARIVAAREAGLPIALIAERLSINRQKVHDALRAAQQRPREPAQVDDHAVRR